MSFCVCQGAILQCSLGNLPSMLNVLPTNMTNVISKPMANIMDNKPLINIMPFGMCLNLNKPIPTPITMVVNAVGVLTPMTPCVPIIPAPWTPGSTTVLLKNIPALTDSSILMCAYGGVIKCNFAGQVTAQLK